MSSVAVVGGGVAGLTAAHLLSARHRVTLFEAAPELGGHTYTVTIPDGPDAGTPVDMGFIVLNDRTYPLLHGLLKEWGASWRWADMSFGYWDEGSGLMYSGKDLSSLFAQRANLLRPAFWRLLRDVHAFGRRARSDLRAGSLGGRSLGRYVEDRGFGPDLVRHYLQPMGSAIWSAPLGEMLDFPAELFARFFDNHGLLDLSERPRWQTVVGGSRSYVRGFAARFSGEVLTGVPVSGLRRDEDGVRLRWPGGERRFDAAVVAAHADTALRLLEDADAEERRLLGPWRYHANRVVLHCDDSVLPPLRRARASWNYRRPAGAEPARAALTYDMTNLQGLRTKSTWCVTLNEDGERPGTARDVVFHHPAFSFESARTQAALPSLNGRRRTWFCGSYFGYGFHEDAVRSAFAAAESFQKSRQGAPA